MYTKKAILAVLLLIANFVHQGQATYCSLVQGDIFACSDISNAQDYANFRNEVEDNLKPPLVYSVFFQSCDFTGLGSSDPGWFKGYENIKGFMCVDCNINSFPLPFMYSMGEIMETINMTSTKLTSIVDPGDTPGLPFMNSLTTLAIAGTWKQSARIATDAFKNYDALATLRLGDMNSTTGPTLSSYSFSNSNLESLDLSDAALGLKYVSGTANIDTIFAHLYQVTNISITGNGFTTLAEDTFSVDSTMQPKLAELKLADNPWNCNCQLQWLKDFINDHDQAIVFDEPYCASPHKPFNDVDFNCP